jgi:ABC-type nitrate/sulfonate/bicarbonate transport system substrate-binding protein
MRASGGVVEAQDGDMIVSQPGRIERRAFQNMDIILARVPGNTELIGQDFATLFFVWQTIQLNHSQTCFSCPVNVK